MKKYLVTYENGITTIMSQKELISKKQLLLNIGAEWEEIK